MHPENIPSDTHTEKAFTQEWQFELQQQLLAAWGAKHGYDFGSAMNAADQNALALFTHVLRYDRSYSTQLREMILDSADDMELNTALKNFAEDPEADIPGRLAAILDRAEQDWKREVGNDGPTLH